MNKLQQALQEWGKKVCKECRAFIDEGKTDQDFYVFQTELPKESPELLLVGINPGGSKPYKERGKERETIDDLTQGSNIYTDTDANSKQSNKLKNAVPLWKHIEEDRVTGINACYFNTRVESDLSKAIWDLCVPLTQELIEILNPERIIFLFTGPDKLIRMGVKNIRPVEAFVKEGMHQDRKVYAIPNHGWRKSGNAFYGENVDKMSEILSEYLDF